MVKFGVCVLIAIASTAVLSIVETTSTGESAERILHGERAAVGQFPHQASIRRTANHALICGGVIIRNNFLLTTANCMQGSNSFPSNVFVVVGTNILSSGDGIPHGVSRITNHPGFDRQTMANDISVIRTTERMVFTNLVSPVRFPSAGVPDGVVATISGWGRFHLNSPHVSQFLLFQHTTTMTRTACIQLMGNLGGRIHANTICTNSPRNTGICAGDFGGALITRDRNWLIGLASWSTGCGDGVPNVYTRVASHLDFIRRATTN